MEPRTDTKIGLKALRGFHAIVQTGSATAAGRELGLSQSAVSRLLAQLEATIGFDLFYRDRGRLVLSPDGLRLYEELDLALDSLERVFSLARDIAGFRVGELKLVAPPSFSEGVLPDVVTTFLHRFPQISLTIDSRSVETSKSLIANRAVDGGFVKLPIDRPDLRPEKMVSSETVCVMRDDHPLARHDVLDPRLLRDEPLILLGLGRSSRAQIEAAFAERQIVPRVRIETHTVGSACALAGQGLGIALVNQLLARSYVRERLAVRAFRPRLVHEYAFVTSTIGAPTRIAEEFRAHAARYFADWEASR